MLRDHRGLALALVLALALLHLKNELIGDARWWNLVMAGLLLVLLARYLWQARDRPR